MYNMQNVICKTKFHPYMEFNPANLLLNSGI